MIRSLVVLSALGCHSTNGSDDSDRTDTDDTTPEIRDTGTRIEPPTDSGTPVVIEDLELVVDGDMVLMVHATFSDAGASQSWVEYRFEGKDWLVAPTIAPGEAVILGIPELTAVEARAALVIDGKTLYSPTATATTGALPPTILQPAVAVYDAGIASSEGYFMTSVATGNYTFSGPYAIEIYDRQGRIVWYRIVPDQLISLYAAPSRDNTHVWYDASDIFGFASGPPHVTRTTLDGRQRLDLPAPNAGQAFAEGPDDTFLYELRSVSHGVVQLDAAGVSTLVWDCDAHMASIGESGGCLLNGCNWNEARGTILASQFETSTVFEVDLATGQTLRQFGQLSSGTPFAFDPTTSLFAYQHWPHWTPEGTLFVSTHQPCAGLGGCSDNEGRDGIQVAAEYTVDDKTQTLTLIWSNVSTDLWATQAGEAWRLPNGNLIQGYGQDGAVREIAPDGTTAFEVAWPRDSGGYRLIGHASPIGDLYALNQGF